MLRVAHKKVVSAVFGHGFLVEVLPDMSCLAGWSSNIQGVPVSNLGRVTIINTEGFHGSPQSVTNVGVVG